MSRYPNRDRALHQIDRRGSGTPALVTMETMTPERYVAAFHQMGLMIHQQWQAELAQLFEALATLTYQIGPPQV